MQELRASHATDSSVDEASECAEQTNEKSYKTPTFALASKLDKKMKAVWRLGDTLTCLLVWGIPSLILYYISAQSLESSELISFFQVLFLVFLVVSLVMTLFIAPWWRYLCWSYQIEENFILISKGVIFKRSTCIPFIRVQNTNTEQGPLLRLFGLSELSVSTAAGTHHIPGLPLAQAQELRLKVAERARIAREDV